jgi:hypothetical protein
MEKKDKNIIELTDEITPPVDGSKRELNMTHDKEWLEKKTKQEAKSGFVGALNPELLGATETYHKSKWKNYIVGELTTDDKKYCEKVSSLDLYNTVEIRKYILAVEKYLTSKENKRSIEEAKNRLFKYVICYALGIASILWALYVGMIKLV